ncbi:hypothetical protein A3K64_00135 [Candidatus Micrarchaeota archaeon RBG_16_36_9]|nr:MAG: hypothetical protein A3K64_00135 [Candidatus Micrarchaeota archaeon RBG_16_36_9]
MEELVITSVAFKNNKMIPMKYTCDGDNVNPPLNVEGIPKSAKTLVLIMDDPDVPMGTFVHWVVWNIPIDGKIEENSVPGTEGQNSARGNSYMGPCPPSGTHRYFFKFYALDNELNMNGNSNKQGVEDAMKGHIVAKGELIGLYKRGM